MLKQLQDLLQRGVPFISLMCLVFGLLCAWSALCELMPFARQVWQPKGSPASLGTVAGALALVVLAIRGKAVG